MILALIFTTLIPKTLFAGGFFSKFHSFVSNPTYTKEDQHSNKTKNNCISSKIENDSTTVIENNNRSPFNWVCTAIEYENCTDFTVDGKTDAITFEDQNKDQNEDQNEDQSKDESEDGSIDQSKDESEDGSIDQSRYESKDRSTDQSRYESEDGSTDQSGYEK